MNNIFKRASHSDFSWDRLGDIKEGRGDLGEDMPVLVYRALQYSINDVLHKMGGAELANKVFYDSGFLVGKEFCSNVLDCSLSLELFIADLQQKMKELKIGILRIEQFDGEQGKFVLTVAQDLDCSGLPPTDEVVCIYDEGFISGIMSTYTGCQVDVKEIDCWSNGDRVCRFEGTINK